MCIIRPNRLRVLREIIILYRWNHKKDKKFSGGKVQNFVMFYQKVYVITGGL